MPHIRLLRANEPKGILYYVRIDIFHIASVHAHTAQVTHYISIIGETLYTGGKQIERTKKYDCSFDLMVYLLIDY